MTRLISFENQNSNRAVKRNEQNEKKNARIITCSRSPLPSSLLPAIADRCRHGTENMAEVLCRLDLGSVKNNDKTNKNETASL